MQTKELMKYDELVRQRKFREAINGLEEARMKDRDVYIVLLLIRAYQEIGEHQKVQELMSDANLNKEMLLLLQSDIEKQNCNIEKAEALLCRLINSSGHTSAYHDLARIKLEKGNLSEAKQYYEKILEIVPNDPYAYHGLAKIAIRNHDYELAQMYYDMILKQAYEEQKDRDMEYIKLFRIGLKGLVYLEIKKENYDKVYEYLLEVKKCEYIPLSETNREESYLKLKLGLLTDDEKNKANMTYNEAQIICYDKEEAIKHVANHTFHKSWKKIHSVFNSDIDIKEIFEEALLKIENIEPVELLVNDRYIIEFDDYIGDTNGVLTKKAAVVTIANSKNVIAIYPVAPYVESEYKIKENKYTGHVRQRKSQVEKFNSKYNIK